MKRWADLVTPGCWLVANLAWLAVNLANVYGPLGGLALAAAVASAFAAGFCAAALLLAAVCPRR
jgi:hypothetical protein